MAGNNSNEAKVEDFIETSFYPTKLLLLNFSTLKIEKKYEKIRKNSIFLLHIISMLTYGVLNAKSLYTLPFELDKVTFGISFLGTIIIMVIKYTCIHINELKLGEILRKFPQKYSKEFSENFKLRDKLESWRKFINFYASYMLTS